MPILSLGLVTTGDAERAAEAVWLGALTQLERAVNDAREGVQCGRWSSWPHAEKRRLEQGVDGAFTIARIAFDLSEQAATLDASVDLVEGLTSAARDRKIGVKAQAAALRRNRELRAASSDDRSTVREVTG
jgi:hypothetical protein